MSISMELLINEAQTAFKTKRLEFRAIENNETDKAIWLENTTDATMQMLADPTPFEPKNKESSDGLFDEMFKNALGGFWVCLLADAQDIGADPNASTKPKAEPAIIGVVLLSKPSWNTTYMPRAGYVSLFLKDGYRRKGYGSEALTWLIDWAFLYQGVHRIGAKVFEYNAASRALFKKLGFSEDGRLRDSVYFKRRFYDCFEMSILEQEWEQMRDFKIVVCK